MTILHQAGHEGDGLFVVDDEVTWAVPSTDTKPSRTVTWTMPLDAIVSTVKAFEAVELLVGHLIWVRAPDYRARSERCRVA
jgi:hypothetical protein